MALVIPSIFTAVDRFSAPMRAMGSAAQSFASKAEGAVQRADRAFNKYTSVLNHAQKEMLGLFSAAALGAGLIETLDYGFEGIKLYDKAITGLQANFRLTDAALIPFRQSINQVAKDSFIGADKIAGVYDVIGSKNRALINTPEIMQEIAKNSVTLSEAWGSDLIPTTQSLVGIMAGFKLTDSAKTIDILAGASSIGAIKGNDLAMALSSVAAEAAHAHVSLSQTAAILEFVDSKTNIGAEGSAAFAKSLLKLEGVGISYKNSLGQFDIGTAITNIRARLDRMPSELAKNDFLSKIFGARTVGKIRPLFDKGSSAELAAYVKNIEKEGIAEQMAAKNTGTLEKAIERVKGAFVNALIESNNTNLALNALKGTLTFVYTHMDAILNIVGAVIAGFLIWKTAVIAMTAVTWIFDTAMGVMGAVTGVANIAIGASPAALTAYRVACALATVQTEELTLAMDANPILLLITAVGLLGIGLYATLKHSDALNDSLDKRNKIIKQTPQTALDKVESAAKKMPLNEAFSYLNSPKYQSDREAAIKADILISKQEEEKNKQAMAKIIPTINPDLLRMQIIESSQQQNVKIHIADGTGGRTNVTSDSDMVPITTSRTMGQGFGIYNKDMHWW